MRFLRDDRGQAIQIGAVLIFGLIVVFLALYQGFVVPNENEEIEFNHNQQLQNELTDMRSDIISMPGETTTQSVSVGLGLRYPSRAVFVNPGPVSGTLRTSGTTNEAVNLTIENATASGEIGDFWNNTEPYNTGAIEYRPGYNIFTNAPRTAYEHSVLYNDFGDGTTLSITGQTIVDGNRITLVTLNGSLSQSRIGDAAVDFKPVSTETRRVEIFNQSSPITLRLPTRMNESEWETVFEEEMDSGNITNVNTTALPDVEDFSLLEVTLEPGTYSLRMAKVGLGTGIEETQEAYLTDVEGDGATIQTGETQTLTLEVRDRYNGQQSGVRVNGSADGGAFKGSRSKTTDNDGRVTFDYNGTVAGTHSVNFSLDYQPNGGVHNTETPENVTVQVTVQEPQTSEGNGSSSAYDGVKWDIDDSPDGFNRQSSNLFTYDAVVADEVPLKMAISPAVQGASVDYSSDAEDALSRLDGTTNANGENTTLFLPRSRSSDLAQVFVHSGGRGDKVKINTTNVAPRSSDLLLHLDAMSLDRRDGYNDGESVNEWVGRTFSEYNASQGTPTQQPTFNDSVQIGSFSGPTVQFDSSNSEFLETSWNPSSSVGDNVTISTVVRVDSAGPSEQAILGTTDTGFFRDPRLYQGFQSGNEPISGVGDSFVGGGTLFQDQFVIYTLQYNGGTVTGYVNKQQQHTETGVSFSGTSGNTFHIGNIPDAALFDTLDGDIAEVMVYEEDLDTDRTAVESYLEEKWFGGNLTQTQQDGLELEIDGDRSSVTIDEGETVDYSVFETFDDGTESEVTSEFGGTVTSGSGDVSVDETGNTVTGDQPATDVTVTADDGQFQASVDVTVVETGSPDFAANIDQTNSPVVRGDDMTFNVTVTNNGGASGTETVTLDIQGVSGQQDSQDVSLASGESDEIQLVWSTAGDQEADDYTADVNTESGDSDSEAVEVLPPADFSVAIDSGASDNQVTEGETATVVADITNGAGYEDTQTIEFEVTDGNGNTLDTQTQELTLTAGESDSVEFTYQTQDGDSPGVTTTVRSENDQDARDVTVLEPADQIIEYESLIKGDGGVVQFDVQNTGSRSVTVTDFAIEAQGISSARNLDNGDSDEVKIIPGSGQQGRANSGPYSVDGTVHSLDTDAIIDGGSSSELDLRFIVNNGGNARSFNLQQIENAANADIIVTVVFDDGTQKEFYFEDI